MTTRILKKSEWMEYFDRFSKRVPAEEVEIEVVGMDLGDQIETKWVVLNGLTYDPKDDILSFFTPHLEHAIAHPKTISVQEDLEGLHSVEVVDSEGRKQIAVLKKCLELSPG